MTNTTYNSIFLPNKYTKWYFNIIENAKNRPVVGYTEKHHIIPRSLNGSDDSNNLIRLTAKEHFICHLLLIFMVEKESIYYHKMIRASIIMKASNKDQKRYTSKNYEISKKLFSKYQKENQKGSKNNQYGTIWVSNYATKKCIKIKKSNLEFYLLDGWIKKRVTNFNLYDINGKRIKIIKNKCPDDIPEILYKSVFFRSKSKTLQKIGFDFNSTNFNIEYSKIQQQLKMDKSKLCYREMRIKYNIPYDRTITLLYKLFQIL